MLLHCKAVATVNLSRLDVKNPLHFVWIIEGRQHCPKWFYEAIVLRLIEITLDDNTDTGDKAIYII